MAPPAGWRAAVVVTLALAWCALAPVAAEAVAAEATTAVPTVPPTNLRYAVTYQNWNAGHLLVAIRPDDNGYLVTSTAKPSMLASMFVTPRRVSTRFVRRHGEVVLASGEERPLRTSRHTGRGTDHAPPPPTPRSFRVNYPAGRIEFSDGRRRRLTAEPLTSVAFPLSLMLLDAADIPQLGGREVLDVSARRADRYTFAPPVEGTVSVPAGEFKCWKITRRRVSNPADSVSVWLSRSRPPLPLKIVITRRDKRSTLLLTAR